MKTTKYLNHTNVGKLLSVKKKKASLLQKLALFIKSLQLRTVRPKSAALSSNKNSIMILIHCYKTLHIFCGTTNFFKTIVLKQKLSLDYLQTCYTTKQFYFCMSIIYLLYIIFLYYNDILLLSK